MPNSMQVYAELRILTARPSDAELEAVPHRLFGHVPASQAYSVGRWISDLASVLLDARGEKRRPIIIGGTGLYFRALTRGLAEVPNVPASVRSDWRERAATLSTPELHDILAKRSSAEAERVGPNDRSRILRALEVIDATGPHPAGMAGRSRRRRADPGAGRRAHRRRPAARRSL